MGTDHDQPQPDDEFDQGGVPFDDDFEVDEPAPTRGGPAHDSASSLIQRGIGYPSIAPIGTRELKRYVTDRWGGMSLGMLSQPPREVRGGGSPSMHNWGMAWDWRWANPGPGRPAADEVIAFCLANVTTLGIQAVHDYVNCRYWKSYSGWNNAHKSSETGFGDPSAQWLHIERTWASANDATTVDVLLAGNSSGPTPAPTPTPTGGLTDRALKLGDSGPEVALMQDFLRTNGFADFTTSDGRFGPRTEAAVRAAQAALAAKGLYTGTVDGIWGPKSTTAAEAFARD